MNSGEDRKVGSVTGSGTKDDEAARVDALLRAIHRDLMILTKRSAMAGSFSAPRYGMLWVLSRIEPATLTELHERLVQSKSTVSTAIDHLVRERLVQRRRSDTDRRQIVISLTKEGRKYIRRITAVRIAALSEAMSGITMKDRNSLIENLSDLRDRIAKVANLSDQD